MNKRENQTHGKLDVIQLTYPCGGQNQTRNQTPFRQKTRRGKPGSGKERQLITRQNQTDQTRQKSDKKTPIHGNAVVMRLSAITRQIVWLSEEAIKESSVRRALSGKPDVYGYQNQAKDSFYERESFFA